MGKPFSKRHRSGAQRDGEGDGAWGWSFDTLTEIDLLIIGKTGNGKSATGNSILRRRAFKSMSSTSSVTVNVSSEQSRYKKYLIKVVDGPGVGDTRLNSEDGKKLVMDEMETAIALNARGYHAFILVARYGVRVTEEDTDALNLLKTIFGQNFIRNFCILVLTCGDNFDVDNDYQGQTIDKWCQAQSGIFKDVYNECEGRVVLFNNISRDTKTLEAQLDNLLGMVQKLKMGGDRYRDEHFQKAEEHRRRALVEARVPIIKDQTMTTLSLIYQRFQEINLNKHQWDANSLQMLIDECNGLQGYVLQQDNGTNALQPLLQSVESLKAAIEAEKRRAGEKELERQLERCEREYQNAKAFYEKELAKNKGKGRCTIL